MKYEYFLTKGDFRTWPIRFKAGLFRAGEGRLRFSFRFRPLFLAYIYIPFILKFWLSIERDVISVMYCGFIDQGVRMDRGKKLLRRILE